VADIPKITFYAFTKDHCADFLSWNWSKVMNVIPACGWYLWRAKMINSAA